MKIVGFIMIKNEDVFIELVIRQVIDFVDEMVVIDTGSADRTVSIVEELKAEYPKIRLHHCHDLKKTHEYLQEYVDTQTWVFGIDGDEIYDGKRLMKYRHLLEGELKNYIQIKGAYFHVTEVTGSTALGYYGPPSHNPTKLYNFSKIKEWKTDGKHILFLCRPRIEHDHMGIVQATDPWDDIFLRCVHMRFVRRSSIEEDSEVFARLTGEDILGLGSRADRGGGNAINERLCYRRGDKDGINIRAFLEV